VAKRVFTLAPGAYAFGEKAVVRVEGKGAKTSLWVGLNNINGSCMGTLTGGSLDALIDALRVAKGDTALPKQRKTTGLGRAAEPTKVQYDGRRKRGPA